MGQRRAGILLHMTSLPGPFGIGDAGPAATRFADWCGAAGFGVWQCLPPGPVGRGWSPYSATSVFAGNPLLVSPRRLEQAGWLAAGGAAPRVRATTRVDFPAVQRRHAGWLREAWSGFRRRAVPGQHRAFEAFVEHPDQSWLEDWALYSALKKRFDGASWNAWPEEMRRRQPAALELARRDLTDELAFHRFVQFAFDRQWRALRRMLRRRGIELLGDLPYYVALDSADVWSHQELFDLDAQGRPLRVGGVPPDYFSEQGQRWGDPVYRWDRMRQRGFAWWIARIRSNLRRFDRLRLDHFRGFAAYWEIDAAEPTAIRGRWVPGPGAELFDGLSPALGTGRFVAEDLGSISDDVVALRESLGLPGMRVLQFAFENADSEHLPHRHPRRCVAYTGTHDNDTIRGWLAGLDNATRQRVTRYLGLPWERAPEGLIAAAYASPAALTIVPLQDLLGLGSEARMNRPGVATGNWVWRVPPGRLTPKLARVLRGLAEEHGRIQL